MFSGSLTTNNDEKAIDINNWINMQLSNINSKTMDKDNEPRNLYPTTIKEHRVKDSQMENENPPEEEEQAFFDSSKQSESAMSFMDNRNNQDTRMDNIIDSNESTLTTTYFGSGFGVFHHMSNNAIGPQMFNGGRGSGTTQYTADETISGGNSLNGQGRVTVLSGFAVGNGGNGGNGGGHSTYTSPYGYGGVHTNVNFLLGG